MGDVLRNRQPSPGDHLATDNDARVCFSTTQARSGSSVSARPRRRRGFDRSTRGRTGVRLSDACRLVHAPATTASPAGVYGEPQGHSAAAEGRALRHRVDVVADRVRASLGSVGRAGNLDGSSCRHSDRWPTGSSAACSARSNASTSRPGGTYIGAGQHCMSMAMSRRNRQPWARPIGSRSSLATISARSACPYVS